MFTAYSMDKRTISPSKHVDVSPIRLCSPTCWLQARTWHQCSGWERARQREGCVLMEAVFWHLEDQKI